MIGVGANTDRALNVAKALKVADVEGRSAFFYIAQKAELNNSSAYLLYPMFPYEAENSGEVADHELSVSVYYSGNEQSSISVMQGKPLSHFKIDFNMPIQTGDFLYAGLEVEAHFLEQKSIECAAARANLLKCDNAHNLSSLIEGGGEVYARTRYSEIVSKYLGNRKSLDEEQSFDAEPVKEMFCAAGPVIAKRLVVKSEENDPLPQESFRAEPEVLALRDVFLGSFVQKLDKKGRVSLPSKFRAVAHGSDVLVLSDPLKPILLLAHANSSVQSVEESEKVSLYDFAAVAATLRTDDTGRIVIPSGFRQHLQAKPESRDELMFVGRGHFVEVMRAAYWTEHFGGENAVKQHVNVVDAFRRGFD